MQLLEYCSNIISLNFNPLFFFKVVIKNFDKILFETVIVNGTIDTEVSKDISTLPEWKLTLQFEIATKKTSGIFIFLACPVQRLGRYFNCFFVFALKTHTDMHVHFSSKD